MTPSMLKGLADGLRGERLPNIAEQVDCAAATVERLHARVEELESALDELAKNGENLLAGGLAHFSREEFAETVAWRARHALVGYDEATKAINAAKARRP